MSLNDPNEAYEVIPARYPPGWWMVTCNRIPVRQFCGRDRADRYATDPAYRASLATKQIWEGDDG